MAEITRVVDVFVILDNEYGELAVYPSLQEAKEHYEANVVGIFVQHKEDDSLWLSSETDVCIMKRDVIITVDTDNASN